MKKFKALLLALSVVSICTIFSCKDDEEVTPTPTPSTIADEVVGRYTVTDTTINQTGPQTINTTYNTVSAEISKIDASRVKLTGFLYQTCQGDTARADVTSTALILVASSCVNAFSIQNFVATRDGTSISYSYQDGGLTTHKGRAVKQ